MLVQCFSDRPRLHNAVWRGCIWQVPGEMANFVQTQGHRRLQEPTPQCPFGSPPLFCAARIWWFGYMSTSFLLDHQIVLSLTNMSCELQHFTVALALLCLYFTKTRMGQWLGSHSVAAASATPDLKRQEGCKDRCLSSCWPSGEIYEGMFSYFGCAFLCHSPFI